ncbi:MAG: hypothetical protein AB1473_05710 [Thermodesulfobacteriota bacterium]
MKRILCCVVLLAGLLIVALPSVSLSQYYWYPYSHNYPTYQYAPVPSPGPPPAYGAMRFYRVPPQQMIRRWSIQNRMSDQENLLRRQELYEESPLDYMLRTF